MKYVGCWSANNGSTCGTGYEGNNKKELAKSMRDMCKGNTFAGSVGQWDVSNTQTGEVVSSGTVRG